MTALPAGIPEPDPGEIIMTRVELGRSRKPWLKDAKFRIYTQETNGMAEGWWGANMNGYYKERVDAGVHNYGQVMTLSPEYPYFIYIEGGPDETIGPVDPNAPKRTGNIVSLAGITVVNMLKVAPNNGTLRAKLMAALGEMPPKEMDTFEKIKDWVEFNFPKPKVEAKPSSEIAVTVTFTEYESGRCRYRSTKKATSRIKITPADIDELIEGTGADAGFDDLMSEVGSLVESKAQENVDTYERIDEDTDNHSADETETEDYEYPYSTVKNAVRAYLIREKPDIASEMGLADPQ